LDAHGINIVGDLQRRSERPVRPIFMDAGLHDEFAFLEQDNKQVSLAQDLAVTGHPELRALAARVAATRLGREQETMHYLIPKLGRSLLLLTGQAAGE
jgi:heme oxygenase